MVSTYAERPAVALGDQLAHHRGVDQPAPQPRDDRAAGQRRGGEQPAALDARVAHLDRGVQPAVGIGYADGRERLDDPAHRGRQQVPVAGPDPAGLLDLVRSQRQRRGVERRPRVLLDVTDQLDLDAAVAAPPRRRAAGSPRATTPGPPTHRSPRAPRGPSPAPSDSPARAGRRAGTTAGCGARAPRGCGRPSRCSQVVATTRGRAIGGRRAQRGRRLGSAGCRTRRRRS